MFQIYVVPPDAAELAEQMGTKFKFWFEDELRGRTLFKEGRRGTGENWAEKLASEFAQVLGIPHASIELAKWQSKQGIISPSFVPQAARLIHGNELVESKVTHGDGNPKIRYYAEKTHTASRVLQYLKRNEDSLHPPRLYTEIADACLGVHPS